MFKYIIFFFFIISNVYCQNSNNLTEFDSIDNYVKTIKYNGDISKLVSDLTKVVKQILKNQELFIFGLLRISVTIIRLTIKRKKYNLLNVKVKRNVI
jgi:hypothetical protein